MPWVQGRYRRHGLGWIPNDRDTRDWDFDKLRLSASAFPAKFDLDQYRPITYDQLSTSSCVGNAVAGPIGVLERQAGLEFVPVSRLALYYNSRARHSIVIQDRGTNIRQCIWAMARVGVPDESLWPFKKSKVNKRPSLESYFMGHGRRGTEYYSIFSEGEQRIHEIKTALMNGYPVIFGTYIGTDFYNVTGRGILDIPYDRIGGHAMYIIGWEETEYEGLLFKIVNSWGDDWGDHGCCYMTEDYIRWVNTHDLTIIKGWKKLREALRR